MKRLLRARLFGVVLFSFLLSLLLFVAGMSASFLLGYRRSLAGWGKEKLGSVEVELRGALAELLVRPQTSSQTKSGGPAGLAQETDAIVPPGIPVEVYDADMRVLYVRGPQHMMGGRGMMHGAGRMGSSRQELARQGFDRPGPSPSDGSMFRVPQTPLRSVQREGRTLGFYRIGVPDFGVDSANARFLRSMRKTIWTGVAFSLPLTFLLALFLSRRLALAARKVAGGIQEMARGNLGVRVPENGAEEIVAIARAANELAGKLGKEESLRRQWAADVAHDLRTPVAALRAQFEGMRDGVLETSGERIARTLRELFRIETLVGDLAELSRLESPEMRIRPVQVDPAKVCGELKARFEPEFSAKGISTEWECRVPEVIADEHLLLRALSNFISNAVRHTPQGGRIKTVFDARAAEARAQGYAVTVFNTGEAIPRDEIDKLFQRLYRGEYARKSAGSGLGLTIALKIAELHGGTVEIESRQGHGTSVTITLGGRHGDGARLSPPGGPENGPETEGSRAENHS